MPFLPRPLFALVLFLLAALPAANAFGQDLPEVTALLPDDFQAAVIVPDLSALSDQAGAFESASGLNLGDLQDALGIFKRDLGIVDGIDDSGAMMVVITDLAGGALMILPIGDYEALAASLGGTPDDLTDITLPNGYTGAMRKLEGYAVLGADTQAVNAYTPATNPAALSELLSDDVREVVATSPLSIVVNNAGADRDALAAQLGLFGLLGMKHIDQLIAFDLDVVGWAPQISSMSQMAARSADVMAIGIDFSEAGMSYTEAYQLNGQPGLPSLFPGLGEADTTQALATLPQGSVVAAFAADTKSVDVAALADRLGPAIGLDGQHALGPFLPQIQELLQQADTVASAYYELHAYSSMPTDRWMNTITVFEVEDAEAFAASLEALINDMGDTDLPVPNDDTISFTTNYRANDQRLEDTRIDRFVIQATLPDSMTDTPMTKALGGLASIGVTGHVAVAEGRVIVMTFDDPATLLGMIKRTVSTQGLGASDALDTMRESHLPTSPSMQAYLSLDAIAGTVNPFLSMMDAETPMLESAATGPIALGISATGDTLITRIFIPTSAMAVLAHADFEINPKPQVVDESAQPGRGFEGGPGLGPVPGRTNPGTRPSTRPNTRPSTQPGRTPGRTPGREPGRGEPGRTPGRGR